MLHIGPWGMPWSPSSAVFRTFSTVHFCAGPVEVGVISVFETTVPDKPMVAEVRSDTMINFAGSALYRSETSLAVQLRHGSVLSGSAFWAFKEPVVVGGLPTTDGLRFHIGGGVDFVPSGGDACNQLVFPDQHGVAGLKLSHILPLFPCPHLVHALLLCSAAYGNAFGFIMGDGWPDSNGGMMTLNSNLLLEPPVVLVHSFAEGLPVLFGLDAMGDSPHSSLE